MDEKLLDKIKEIARHYGWGEQHMIAIEEMSELTKAICKNQRKFMYVNAVPIKGSKERTAIVEELADVINMSIQLVCLLSAKEEIENMVRHKVDRQIGRINKECQLLES